MKKYQYAILFLFIQALILPQAASDASLKKLVEGNKRYVSGAFKSRDYVLERDEQRKGQHPYAIVLTCADSRVPPEIIFDEDLGQLFVVRVAGNVIDEVTLGSIEYAAEHLHVPLLLILGHSACGAVKATLEGGDFGRNINALVQKIKPAVGKAQGKSRDKSLQLPLAIEENVDIQAAACISESAILQELVHEQKFKISAGIYNIESGEVSFFEPNINAAAHSGKQAEKEIKGEKKDNEGHGKEPEKHKKESYNGSGNQSVKYDFASDKNVRDNIFTDGHSYCVQISSWRNKAKADQELQKIKKKHPEAFIMEFSAGNGGQVWYRIRVGTFTSIAETEKSMASLE